MWELNHKKAEHWRTDTFELWSWKRLLRVPWTARRSNQSILKEINLDYSLEGLMLKLNLHYFDHLIQRANSLKKTLILGKIKGRKRGDDRGWDGWMASLTQWTWVWTSSRRWWKTLKPGLLQSMGSQRVGHDWVLEQEQDCEQHTLSAEVRRRVVWWLEPASSTFFWKTSEDANQSEWQETQESMCLFPLMA